jgi:hypothetical protein
MKKKMVGYVSKMVAKIRRMSGYGLVLVYVKLSQKNQWACK